MVEDNRTHAREGIEHVDESGSQIPEDLLEATASLSDDDFDFSFDMSEEGAKAEPSALPQSSTALPAEEKTSSPNPPPQASPAEVKQEVPPALTASVLKQKSRHAFIFNLAAKPLYLALAGAVLLFVISGLVLVLPVVNAPVLHVVPQPVKKTGLAQADSDQIPPATAPEMQPQPIASNESTLKVQESAGKSIDKPVEPPRLPPQEVLQPKIVQQESPAPKRTVSAQPERREAKAVPAQPRAVTTALRDQAESLDYFMYAAHRHELRGEFAPALSAYKKADALQPGDHRLLNKIGYVLVRLSLHDSAVSYFERALGIDDAYVPALINQGICSAAQGLSDEAVGYLEKAVALDESSTDALYNLRLAYRQQGDFKRFDEVSARLQKFGVTNLP